MVPTLYMKALKLRKLIVAKAHASLMKAPALDAKARKLGKPVVAKAHASIRRRTLLIWRHTSL